MSTTPSPQFREARREDLPLLVELLVDDVLGREREGKELTPYAAAFEAIAADPSHSLLIIEWEGEVVGFLQLSFLPGLTFKGSWRAQVEGVRIASHCRGKGLGRALLQEAIRRARERHCLCVQLTTNKVRPEALAFYQSLGFEPTHLGLKLPL